MQNKDFSIKTNGSHNYVIIEPNIAGIIVTGIYTYDDNGNVVNIFSGGRSLEGKLSFRYKKYNSPYIVIKVSHEFASTLEVGTDLSITVMSTDYRQDGSYSSKEYTVPYGTSMFLYSNIQSEGDCGILARLNINLLDKDKKIIESAIAHIPLNNDHKIIQEVKNRTKTIYPPKSLALYSSNTKLDSGEYTVDGSDISIVNDERCFAVYQADFSTINLSDNILIDKTFLIKASNKRAAYISYTVDINVINMDVLRTNITPVIKELALIVRP